ncbi:hypothetical protein [Streptomyces sp. NRRL S-475]|uniref:hypothetical protein n=1 Tax=Streptomyces sp. NRRL S-475 TaxID=1463910 RepID=UPI00131D73E5|nr:hypothetical protein [Streptomyces sp. NRRL S-475]
MRHVAGTSVLAATCLTLAACSGGDGKSDPQPSPRTALRFGQAAETAGAGGKGTAEITPETVVYVGRAAGGTPERGLFAVVTFQAGNRAERSVTTPAALGAFRWRTPDGKTVKAGNSEGAGRIDPDGFNDGGGKPVVRANTHQVNTVAFDITSTEKGGTLVYVDGEGVAFRWQVPSTNSGPTANALKSALK